MTDATTFGRHSTAEEVTAGLDLTGRRYLVTGCNSGLGLETTRVLSMRGAHVVAAARTVEKAQGALDSLGVAGTPVACELGNLNSVRAAVATIRELPPLDGIIANAGIMALPTLEQIHGIERQLFINHVGHFALITPLLDRLTDAGRVVIVSSGAHHNADRGLELDNLSGEHEYVPWRMYGRSKLANLLYARALSKRFEGTAKTANALHPGVIETNLGRHIPDREAMYERLKNMLRTVPQGAATQCWAATRPELAEVSGVYFSDCAEAETLPEAQDEELAEALWTRTEEIIRSL